MNAVLPYHRGVLFQKGRGIGGIFSSLLRTLLPIWRTIIKSAPSILKSTSKPPIGRRIRKSAKKVALNTAKNLIKSGDVNKTFKKSIEDSKREVEDVLKGSKASKKRKLNNSSHCQSNKYHFMKWILGQNPIIIIFKTGKLLLKINNIKEIQIYLIINQQ